MGLGENEWALWVLCCDQLHMSWSNLHWGHQVLRINTPFSFPHYNLGGSFPSTEHLNFILSYMYYPDFQCRLITPCVWTGRSPGRGRWKQSWTGMNLLALRGLSSSITSSSYTQCYSFSFTSVFKDCHNSFLYSLSIALPNVSWLSTTFISSNNFEILEWQRGGLWTWQGLIFTILLIAYDFTVPLNVNRFFSLQIVSLLDSNFWAVAARLIPHFLSSL